MTGRSRTLAPWYSYIVGAALVLAGIFGFLADATFDTAGVRTGDSAAPSGNASGQLQGDGFLGFEVNGWHNVLHLVSGVVLLALADRRGRAKLAAPAFGVVYAVVAIVGLLDGNDVLGVIPVNPADNSLHIALSLLGLLAGLSSRRETQITSRRRPSRRIASVASPEPPPATGRLRSGSRSPRAPPALAPRPPPG